MRTGISTLHRVVLLACLIAAMTSSRAFASDYFVQAESGRDTNPGTPERPFKTLGRLRNVLQSGDVAYLSGLFTDSLHLVRPRRVTLRQWPGHPQAVVANSRRVTAWMGTQIHSAFVGTGLDITAVSVRWGDPAIKDESGRDKTFLIPHPDQSIPYTWSYEPTSGVLRINLNGEDPNAGRHAVFPVEYCLGSPVWIGINLELAQDCIVDGIHFRHSIGSTNGTYGLKVGGKHNIIRHCKSWHLSWHHMTFVGSGTDSSIGNLMHDCECYGFGNTSNANMVTLYSTDHDVRENHFERVRLNVYQMLRYDNGQPLSPDIVLDGFYSHTGRQGASVLDNQWTRCTVRHFENPGAPFGIGDSLASSVPPADTLEELDWTRWPNRVVDSEFFGLSFVGTPVETAFVRCTFVCPDFGRRSSAAALFNYQGIPGHRALLLDACYVGFDAAGASPKSVFVIRRNEGNSLRLNVLNSTFVQLSDQATNWVRFVSFEGNYMTPRVKAFGSVIDLEHAGAGSTLIHNDIGIPDWHLRFSGNYYHGFRPVSYSSQFTRASEARWSEVIDRPSGGAVYGRPARLADPLRSPKPAEGSDLSTRRWFHPVHARVGINAVPYAGQYGAWQTEYDAPCPADFNTDSFVNTQDFFDFMSAYFSLTPPADVNLDSFVNSQDFFDFVTAFLAGC